MQSSKSFPPSSATDTPGTFADALNFWERRRVIYNGLLAAVVIAWIAGTWPHFRPAFTWASLGALLVLALMANLFYCAAYLVDLAIQHTSLRAFWRRWRWSVWLLGTLFAILATNYWIADEIYSFVH